MWEDAMVIVMNMVVLIFSAAFSTLHRHMQQLRPLCNSRDDVNMKVLDL